MNSKLIIMFLFLLSISTASAYIEPRYPYIVESSASGITEDESGNIIITNHGCLFEVNTTFHYRYGFEKIDTILVIVNDPAGKVLDFEYMDLNQTSTKEGYAKVWLEIPGENRIAGKYIIKYIVEYYNALDNNELEKTFLQASTNFVIEPIEEEETKTEESNIPDKNDSISTLQIEEPELNIVAPSQDEEEIQTHENVILIQDDSYTISPAYFAIAALIIVAIFLRKND